MRINQNIMAFNAYRNLASTNTVLAKSLEKLSSGYRINRAADDASGLVISQGLRSQVSGLRQATRNAQDGVSCGRSRASSSRPLASLASRDSPRHTRGIASMNSGTFCLLSYPLMAT